MVELLRTPWDHQKPAQALLAVTTMFDKLISQLLNISGSRARLLPNGEGHYMASLEHVDVPVGAEIYLCLHSAYFSVDDKHPVDKENSRLCPPGQLENLINYSLPGIPLSVVQRLPHNLSVRDDTYCLRLDTHNQIWRDAWREKRVIFHWGDAPEDLQVELLWLGEA